MILTVRRKVVAALAVLGCALGIVVAAQQPAAAYPVGQPPCYGASCVGKDPNLSLRDVSCTNGFENDGKAYDVVTIGLAGYNNTSVTLRYSPTCGANWARWNGGTWLDYWVQTADGRRASGFGGSAPPYTTMVDGTQLARVCIFSGFDDTQNCSAWY